MREGYIPKDQRKKILFLCDDIRMHSGVATMAREIVIGTCHRYNWVNVGAAINHPEVGKKLDLSQIFYLKDETIKDLIYDKVNQIRELYEFELKKH